MKQYINIINIALAALLFNACSKSDTLPDGEEQGPQITELKASLVDIHAGEATRAATQPTYHVNSDDDPTKKAIVDRDGWEMKVEIHEGNTPYTNGGVATYTYSTADNKWKTTTQHCFPNYTKQMIKASSYPKDWNTSTAFITDQSQPDKSNILKQDILIESNSSTLYNPAKTIEVKMKHANSMLDFIVNDIVHTDISTVTVNIGGTPYSPYQIKTSPVEYLLIVPVTTDATAITHNPTIEITTKNQKVYKQQITLIGAMNEGKKITDYTVNTCYCFTLRGLELLLSPITVTDWTTGEAVAGDYIAVTAYPTFRGKPNETYYLYYDNCLKESDGTTPKMQKITFNSRGECTLKPDGRIITHIGVTATLAPPTVTLAKDKQILLSDMIVDLNSILPTP